MSRLFILFFVFFVQLSWAQTDTDIKLADHYYTQGEFEKAKGYYEGIYNTNPNKIYLNRLLECLIATDEEKKAEKILKKAVSEDPSNLILQFQFADFYEQQGTAVKAKKIYENLLSEHITSPSKGIALFNSFLSLSKIDLATRALENSKKKFKNYPFHFQEADLYAQTNNKEAMVQTYMQLLETHDYYDKSVKKALLRRLDLSKEQAPDFLLLKKELFGLAQKVNSSVVFSELLIWLYMQVDNFAGVYSQVVAVDLRSKANGMRLYSFAKTCSENKDFSTALKAFQEAKDMTSNSDLKFMCLKGLLHVGYIQITEIKRYTQEELDNVLMNYELALQTIGPITSRTLSVLMEYAEILAYYASEKEKALELLIKTYESRSLTDIMKAEVKMLRADIELLKGNVWDAALLYMQISEDFNFEIIGNRAKFKNARIFYYEGEFEFAQSQLDVLKQSTSKLLSNDALDLSIMITDNYGLDSNYIAMAWFSKADLYIEQLQFSEAFSLFDSIQVNYPFHSLADEILYKRAHAMSLNGEWNQAIGFYDDIIKFHESDILADDAMFKAAELVETKLNNADNALERYKKLLITHPGSLYAHEARKRVRLLRGEELKPEDEF